MDDKKIEKLTDKLIAAQLVLESATRKVLITKHTEELLDYVGGPLFAVRESELAKKNFNLARSNYNIAYNDLKAVDPETPYLSAYKIIENYVANCAIKV
jgi:hypothetical protein